MWPTWSSTTNRLIGDAIVNDGPGLMLIIEKFPWANTLDVTRGVEAALDEMRPGLTGIKMDSTIFRPADFIELALHNLTTTLLVGSLLVFLVLLAFLYDWRTALISLVAIPLSLMAAGLVLYLTGATINTMILAGFVIAVGVVVDDAIIDIENITRRLRLQRSEGSDRSTASIILESSLEVRGAIIYATLIDVRGARAGAVHRRAERGVLPAARDRLRPGGPGIAPGRADGDAGTRAHPAVQREDRAAPVTGRRPAAGRLFGCPVPDRPQRPPRVRRRRPRRGHRGGRHPAARRIALPRVQGAGLPDALGDDSGHVPARGEPDRPGRQS